MNVIGPRVKKFNIVINLIFQFQTVNTIKSKLSVYAEIWYLDYFKYAECSGDADFFHFLPETSCLGKFGPKIQNCQFRLKFGTKANSHIQNSMVMFIFFRL